jgi:fermentation-respiration switch protein FrsA (DUF1100 family)
MKVTINERCRSTKQQISMLILALALTFLIPYLMFAPSLNQNFAAQILFHPEKLAGKQPSMQRLAGIFGEELFFSCTDRADSPQLNGWLYVQPGAKSIVLFNHGNRGNVTNSIPRLKSILACGASLFVYDYRGFGRSDGIPTVSGVIEDASTAFDYLVKNKGYSPSNIILYGESLGSCITIALARQRKCAGIVMQSGCTSAESLCKEQAPIMNAYPSFLFFRPSLDNVSFVRGKHPPLLIVAGKKDETVSVEHSLKLYKNATPPARLLILPNSYHSDFEADLKLYEDELTSFLSSGLETAI